MEPLVFVQQPRNTYNHQKQMNTTSQNYNNSSSLVQNNSTSVSNTVTNGQVLTKPRVSPNQRTRQHTIQGYSTIVEDKEEFPKCVVVQRASPPRAEQHGPSYNTTNGDISNCTPPNQQHSTGTSAANTTNFISSRPIHSKFSSSQPSLSSEDLLRRHTYSPTAKATQTHRGPLKERNRLSFAGMERTHQNGRKMVHFFPASYNVTLTKLSLEDLRPQPIAVPTPTIPESARRVSTSCYVEEDEEDIKGTLVSRARQLSSENVTKAMNNGVNVHPAEISVPKVPTKQKHLGTYSHSQQKGQITQRQGNASTLAGNSVYHGSAVCPKVQSTCTTKNTSENTVQESHLNGVQPSSSYIKNGNTSPPIQVQPQPVYQTTSNNGQHSIEHTNDASSHTAHSLKTTDIIQPAPTRKHFPVQNQQQQQQQQIVSGKHHGNDKVSGNHLQQPMGNNQLQNGVQHNPQKQYQPTYDKVNDINSTVVNEHAFEPSISPTDPQAMESYSWPNTPNELVQSNYIFHQQSLTSSTSQVNPSVEYNCNTIGHVQYPSYPSVQLSNSQVNTDLMYSNQSMSLDELRATTNMSAPSTAATNSQLPSSHVSTCSSCSRQGEYMQNSCSSCQTRHTPTPDQLDGGRSSKESDCSTISRSVSISPFSPTGTDSNHESPPFGTTQSEGTLLQQSQKATALQPTSSLQHCPVTYTKESSTNLHSQMKGAYPPSMGNTKNDSDYTARQRSSTLPASYRKSPKHDRSGNFVMRRSSSLRDILEVDESDHDVSRAEIKLSDYIELNANRFPQKVKICKGFCSHSTEVTLSRGEVFNIHFLKHTKVITMNDMYGISYDVPLTSMVKFGVVYNPFNVKTVGTTHTLGFQFTSAKEIMDLKYLPTVVSVTKSYHGSLPENSVKEGEILIVQGVKTIDNGRLLRVVSRNGFKTKFLTENCNAFFTTSTLSTQLTVEEMFRLSLPLPQKAMLFPSDEMRGKIPTYMMTTTVNLTHFNVVKSVIATPAILYNVMRPPQPIEVMADLDTEVQEVVGVSESKKSDLITLTQSIHDNFDPYKTQLYKDTPNSQAYSVQTLLWTLLNTHQQIQGVQLAIPDVIATNDPHHGISSPVQSREAGVHIVESQRPSSIKEPIQSRSTPNAPSLPTSKFELEIRLKAVEFHSHRMDAEVVKLSRSLSDVSQEVTQIKSILEKNVRPIKEQPSTCASSVQNRSTLVKQQEIPTSNGNTTFGEAKTFERNSHDGQFAYVKQPVQAEPMKQPLLSHSNKQSNIISQRSIHVTNPNLSPTHANNTMSPILKTQSSNNKLAEKRNTVAVQQMLPRQTTNQQSSGYKYQHIAQQLSGPTQLRLSQQHNSHGSVSTSTIPGNIKTGSPKQQFIMQTTSDRPPVAPKPHLMNTVTTAPKIKNVPKQHAVVVKQSDSTPHGASATVKPTVTLKPSIAVKPPVAVKPTRFQNGYRSGDAGSPTHNIQHTHDTIESTRLYRSPQHNTKGVSKVSQVQLFNKDKRPPTTNYNVSEKKLELQHRDLSSKCKTHHTPQHDPAPSQRSPKKFTNRGPTTSHQTNNQQISAPLPVENKPVKSPSILDDDFVDLATDECDIDAIVNDLTLFCSQIEDEISKYATQVRSDGPTLV